MSIVAVIAIVLACGFITTRVLISRAENDYPATGRFVTVGGLRQHVLDRGRGPVVVFVHGAFGALQDFEATILDRAAESYRCIAWDRPGHGYSERSPEITDPAGQARILCALLDGLGIERPVLVGFSYGGAVVLAAALESPERFSGVVMLNGPSHVWPDPIELAYELPAVPLVGPLLTETLLMPLGTWLAADGITDAFAPRPVAAAFDASPVALSLRPGSYRANAEDVRTLKAFFRSHRGRYPQLAVPITMVVSEGDRVVSPTIHSLQLEVEAPNVTVIRVPDAGHQILYTHPELVLDIIGRAVRGD